MNARSANGIVALLPCVLGACGGGSAADHELAARVAALEATQARLIATLKEHGIVFHVAPAANDDEQVARDVEALIAVIDRLEAAQQGRDVAQGQQAMQALTAAQAALGRNVAKAVPALLAAATSATPARQPALFDSVAKVGGPAAVAPLVGLFLERARPAVVRVHALRGVVGLDAVAAAPLLRQALDEQPALPDLFLLVHLLAESRHQAAVPVLQAALASSTDRSVRCHAATGLGGFLGEPVAAALAAAAIGDEYPAVRSNALRALGRAAAGERVRAVAEQVVAKDADAQVRAVAEELLRGAARR